MSFLVGLLKSVLPTILDWIVGKIMPEWRKKESNNALDEREQARVNQSDIVEALRLKKLLLEETGQPVPKELIDELRIESRKLTES